MAKDAKDKGADMIDKVKEGASNMGQKIKEKYKEVTDQPKQHQQHHQHQQQQQKPAGEKTSFFYEDDIIDDNSIADFIQTAFLGEDF